jgi:hypothetical protein
LAGTGSPREFREISTSPEITAEEEASFWERGMDNARRKLTEKNSGGGMLLHLERQKASRKQRLKPEGEGNVRLVRTP